MAQQPTGPEAPATVRKVKAGHASQPHVMEVKTDPTDLVPWDLDTAFSVMGGRYPRQEALDKATGRAKYTYDVSLPGILWARMLRAPMPAAEILGIDTSRAEALPGVKAVWTTDAKRVRFAGQDIAAVAAVSQEIAEDAARLIQVRYQPRPFVTDMQTATKDGAPLVFETNELPEEPENEPDARRKGNLVGPNVSPRGKRGDLAKGLAEAEVVHEGTYTLPVHTHCCLETHGVVARWEGERLTVWASTQGVFAVRNGLADALKVDRKNVTVLTEHMGGGFGSKLGPSAAGSAFAVVACKLARQAGAPVKLMLGRQEEQVCTGNAPSAQMTVTIGARRDGTLTAVHFRSFGSAGVADGAGFGGPASTLYADCPNLLVEEHDVFTNAGPAAPLRAPGHSQGAFGVESAVDELAFTLGMDPLELRRKNESSPVRRIQYDLGAKAIAWERRNQVPGGTPGPRKRGIGVAAGNWYVIVREKGVSAEVRIHRDGSVEVFSGAQDLGTGFRTAMAVVAAEELGLQPTDVCMHVGDTRLPEGPGSGGSLTTNTVAPVVRLAAHDALAKLFEAVAPALGARPEELAARGGRVFLAADASRGLSFKQAAAKMPGEQVAARADRKRQFETYRRDLAGAQFAEVEVDTETGLIRVLKLVGAHDCGFPVNALTAESQVIGGMVQGVSWALLENRVLDRNLGTMVNPNLESYKLLGARDMFEAVPILTPIANAGNNTSTAGVGEPPIVPTLAAVANAVFNAIGVRLRDLPLTPDRVLAALAQGGGGAASRGGE